MTTLDFLNKPVEDDGLTYDDLTDSQKNAHDRVLLAIKEKRHITIRGPAGTGKTFLTKFLLKTFKEMDLSGIALVAPTHAAKRVLAKRAARPADTIARLFKINPVTLEADQVFEQRKIPDLSKVRILIIDEISMAGKKLRDVIMRSIPSYCVIIAIGDHAQLSPVDDGDANTSVSGKEKSPFFTDPRFEQVELTEVKRQGEGSHVLKVATDIRNGSWIYPSVDANGDGVIKHPDFKSFMMTYFSLVKKQEDFIDNRIFAYTNKSVDKLANIVRKHIFKTDLPFIEGEIVVLQQPLMKPLRLPDGKIMEEVIFNNGEMVTVVEAVPVSYTLTAREMEAKEIRCWRLLLKTYEEDEEEREATVNVIVDEAEEQAFSLFQGMTAQKYKEMKANGLRPRWDDFWANKKAFIKVRSLSCSTIHKAQGVTVENAFYFSGCVLKADAETAQELNYVVTTRPTRNVHYV